MSVKKTFLTVSLDKLIPYENNPRDNGPAIPDTVQSIKECENLDPIEIDEGFVILSGHTRLMALKQLGYTQTEVVQYEGLTEEQKRKYRILANKTNELADWNMEKLEEELKDLDFSDFTFDFGIDPEEQGEDDTYTQETKIPQYEPTGERVNLADLFNDDKANALIDEIDASDIPQDIKGFLKMAACRHIVFDYGKIADYYVNANAEVQKLMERSALVIIDYGDAVANGYTALKTEMEKMWNET